MTQKTFAAVSLLVCVGVGTCSVGADKFAEQSSFVRRAQEQARSLPIQSLGERTIVVDGELDDWGDMRQDSFAIHQLLDHTLPDFHQAWKAQWENEPVDAALIRLGRDREALYVAIQVADDSVVSPATNRLGGDVVDLYLDLRPLTGDGPTLGHVKYTEGVCQLVCAPPCGGEPAYSLQPESEMWTGWRPGQKAPRLGPYEVKGRTFPGGYAIEMRIPLSSFPERPAADRLAQPIGFEVMITDLDAARPQGRPERLYYSCSGYSGGRDYFKSASLFACADPDLHTALPLSRLRANPLKQAPGGDECEGWIVTALDEKDVPAAFAAAGKAVPGYVEPAVPSKEPPTTYPCKALGLAFHHRRVLSRLPAAAPSCVGNRYAAVFPAGGAKVKVDGELGEWQDFDRTAAQICEFGNLQACVGLPGRTDSAAAKLMTGNDTLYVGMRVKDDSVICPGGATNRPAGDAVEVFLDVRPLDGGLSSGTWGEGVYHFWLTPPTEDGLKAELRQGSRKMRQAGPIEFAGAKQKDGYAFEMAIPLSSLLEKPVAGRFQQPFGFEAMVADIDKPNAGTGYEPLLTYSWGGFEEKQLQSNPSFFSCADYVPNRLPEIRALVDASPVTITADFSNMLQPVSGFGGNLFRDAEPAPHGGGPVPGQYGPCRPGTLYVAEHLSPAWVNVNVSLQRWGDPANPDRFGTWTPAYSSIATRVTAKMLAPMDATPIDRIVDAQKDGSDSHGIWDKSIIDWFLISLKPWARPDTRLCMYVDKMPLEALAGGGKPLPRDVWPKYAECITSYMEYARKVHGIEFACFAVKNVPWGAYKFADPREYVAFLKLLGDSLKKKGLKTRLLLCDTDNLFAFRWYAELASDVVNDTELREHVGAVGIEVTGALEPNLATYRLWSDLASSMDRPLLITSFGRPYTGSCTYLFDEMRLWQQIMRELKPAGMLIRQFVDEKANKWIMVWNRQVVQDRGLPALHTGTMPARDEDVLPSLRFWFTRHFCDLTPVGHAVQTTSDHPQVLVTGFSGTRGGRDVRTLHVSNAGPARKATISGLPETVKSLRLVRSGAGEAFHDGGAAAVAGNTMAVDLPAWSMVSLTTLPLGH